MADTRLPNGQTLTERELEKAKEEARAYIRRMLSLACVPCSSHAFTEIEESVRELVSIFVTYGYTTGGTMHLTAEGERQRDAVIRELIETLEELAYTYVSMAEDDDDDKALLVAWLKERYKGATIDERITSGVNGIESNLERIIRSEMQSNGGIIPSDLDVAVGVITGVKSLRRLLETEVTRGWQHKWGQDHKDAMFVHVYRGSSYPCDLCDSMVALGWQLVGNAQLPPYHPNCCCYAVYI